jgi:hypothetical protein
MNSGSCQELTGLPIHIPQQPIHTLSAATVSKQLGSNLSPWSVLPAGPFLYINSTSTGNSTETNPPGLSLDNLEQLIANVSAADSLGFEFEMDVPDAASLGPNIAASMQAIAPPGITVAMAGTTTIRVTSDGTVNCDALNQFGHDFTRFAHHTKSDTPVASVFFVDPAATGNALGATAIPFPVSGATALGAVPAAAANSATSNPSAAPTGGATGGGGGAASPAAGGGGSTSASSPTGGASTPSNTTQPSSSTMGGGSSTSGSSGQTITIATTTTTPAATSATSGNTGSTPPSTAPVTTTTISTTQPVTPPAAPSISATPAAPSAPAQAQPYSINGRDLLFTGGTPGDDGWITEKKRALALLDLPQPQVLVNAWVIQNSATKPEEAGQLTSLLHGLVNSFNDTIQFSLYLGWNSLIQTSSQAGFFDRPFYNYITLQTVIDPQSEADRGATSPSISAGTLNDQRPNLGICPVHQYCLGYTTLFHPAQPRLTDLLLTLLAAKDPGYRAEQAIDAMESGPLPQRFDELARRSCADNSNCKLTDTQVRDLKRNLLIGQDLHDTVCGCQKQDLNLLIERATDPNHVGDLRLPLECFRAAMVIAGEGNGVYAGKNPVASLTLGNYPTPRLGLARAALADFLFNYKMSVAYPHQFEPYDLTASAQALDAALSPYILAFNEDLQAFQSFVRAELVVDSTQLKMNRDKNTFINDGIITVQTTSGDVATVNTGTQSFLDASRAPSVSQLLSSITGASPGNSSNVLSGVISNLSFNQAQVLEGALAAYQSTSLNVGRQLNLVVKPRSLLGAEAAEMDVQLNADQGSTAPSYWTPGSMGGAGKAADLSAVTQHDTTTHVRIDSIELFDISSMTAILSKGRDKFPLLPPFVEIPYIGTLVGIPLKAASEYHSSSAVISAVIVPTATNIAYSLRFSSDRVLNANNQNASDQCINSITTRNSLCKARTAKSLDDLVGISGASVPDVQKDQSGQGYYSLPVAEFHHMMVHCIITLGDSPYAFSGDGPDPYRQDACANLSFANALHEGSDEW